MKIRKLIDLRKTLPKNFSYAEAVKLSPIVLKPISSETLSKDQINEKMSQALVKIKVASAKFTVNGKILVNEVNKVNVSEVKETLMFTLLATFA